MQSVGQSGLTRQLTPHVSRSEVLFSSKEAKIVIELLFFTSNMRGINE